MHITLSYIAIVTSGEISIQLHPLCLHRSIFSYMAISDLLMYVWKGPRDSFEEENKLLSALHINPCHSFSKKF